MFLHFTVNLENYSVLQLRWKIIFPKSRAHMHTLYGSVCAWARDFARNGKIIFQHNCNALYFPFLAKSHTHTHTMCMGTRLCKEWENNFPMQLQFTLMFMV